MQGGNLHALKCMVVSGKAQLGLKNKKGVSIVNFETEKDHDLNGILWWEQRASW